jgi:hypothetical protein
LIYPDGSPASSYPDDFEGESYCFKTKINEDADFYASADLGPSGGATWKAGRYCAVMLPDLTQPLRHVGQKAIALQASATIRKNSQNGFLSEIRGLANPSIPPQMPGNEELRLKVAINYNLAINYSTFPENGLAPEQWTFHGVCESDGTEFFGIPFDSNVCRITAHVAATSSTTMGVSTVNTTGPGVEQTVAVAGPGDYQIAVPGVDQRTSVAAPGMGIRIRFFGGAGVNPTVLDSVTVSLVSGTALKNVWLGPQVPDSELLIQQMQQYRTVAQSTLVTYKGPELNNAGRAIGYSYRGGYSPGWLNFHDYEALGSLNGSVDNSIKLGTYGYWQPGDTKAMQFRSYDRHVTDFPYLIFGGIFVGDSAGTVAPSVLRFITVSHIEAITSVQYLSKTLSRIDRFGEKAATMQFLKTFPQLMENPVHLSAIMDVLKKAVKGTFSTGKKMVDFYHQNKAFIDPVATKLFEAAIAL